MGGKKRLWVSAVVPAAGLGRRMASRTGKPFIDLCKVPIIIHTLRALDKSNSIDEIIVAVHRSSIKRLAVLVKRYSIRKVSQIVCGGSQRNDSVRNCIAKISACSEVVLIHDGARPLVDQFTIKESIRLAAKYGVCIAACRESDTVKVVDENLFIKKTLDRNTIFRAQTPQAFRRALLDKAYSRKNVSGATDDASLAESVGAKVKILETKPTNIKITTREDIKIAEVLI